MRKEMIAPLICAAGFIGVIIAYGAAILWLPIPWGIKTVVGASMPLLGAAMIYVLIQRRKEIEKEVEDDLGQY